MHFAQLVLIMLMIFGVKSVTIKSVLAPSVIESGNDLVLDCDYDYQEDEANQLDLKWYFNGSPTPIYQWVPALDMGPQVVDVKFKDKIDLTYTMDESDQFKKHRAIRILNPNQHHSGTYKCKISSFLNEDVGETNVLVFVPPSEVQLEPNVLMNDIDGEMTITCKAKSVFPRPSLYFTWGNGSEIGSIGEETVVLEEEEHDGLFDVMISATIDVNMTTLDEDMILCEIFIPGTSFNKVVRLSMLNSETGTEIIEEESTVTETDNGLQNTDIFTLPADSLNEENLIVLEIDEATEETSTETHLLESGCGQIEILQSLLIICLSCIFS